MAICRRFEELYRVQDNRVAPDNPERILQLRQALVRLEKRGAPKLVECARLLASGLTAVEVAAEMGLQRSRTSQLRNDARKIIDPCL